MSTTHLPPPSFYKDKLTYAYEWDTYRAALQPEAEAVTIFDLVFASAGILVACTSQGELCFFHFPQSADEEDSDMEDDMLPRQKVVSKTCFYRFQVTNKGALYSVKVNIDSNRTWLIAGGDGGVWLYDWDAIKTDMDNQSLLVRPRHHFMLHPSPYETEVEVNDTCFRNGTLFGAAGDDFGCYKWDVETGKLVTTYQSKRGFLQTLQMVPNTNILLTGGGEGALCMWDMQQDCLIDRLHIPDSGSDALKRSSQPFNNTRISSAIARDENWWTIGGERRSNTLTSRNQSTSDTSGFIATIHGPTRTIVSQLGLRETPQKLAYVDNDAVVSVSNESYVSHFNNPLSLENPQRVWCHSKSAFAAALSPTGILAVAGVGGSIDLYRNQTQLVGTLRL